MIRVIPGRCDSIEPGIPRLRHEIPGSSLRDARNDNVERAAKNKIIFPMARRKTPPYLFR